MACGKNLFDDSTILLHHIHMYVKETQRDVTTPEYIVRTQHNDVGTANCAVVLVTIHRDRKSLKTWSNGVSGPHMITLRCVSEFNYGEYNDGIFTV